MANLIGKHVTIKSKDSWACGEWGTVVAFDGEYYHVAIADDRNMVLVFNRKEIKVSK